MESNNLQGLICRKTQITNKLLCHLAPDWPQGVFSKCFCSDRKKQILNCLCMNIMTYNEIFMHQIIATQPLLYFLPDDCVLHLKLWVTGMWFWYFSVSTHFAKILLKTFYANFLIYILSSFSILSPPLSPSLPPLSLSLSLSL